MPTVATCGLMSTRLIHRVFEDDSGSGGSLDSYHRHLSISQFDENNPILFCIQSKGFGPCLNWDPCCGRLQFSPSLADDRQNIPFPMIQQVVASATARQCTGSVDAISPPMVVIDRVEEFSWLATDLAIQVGFEHGIQNLQTRQSRNTALGDSK